MTFGFIGYVLLWLASLAIGWLMSSVTRDLAAERRAYRRGYRAGQSGLGGSSGSSDASGMGGDPGTADGMEGLSDG